MTYYLDENFVVHVQDDGTMTPWVDDAGIFDGKCTAYITGFRIIPSGKTWTRKDGTIFKGEMIAPWKPYSELDAVQREYERQEIISLREELQEADAAQSAYEQGVQEA